MRMIALDKCFPGMRLAKSIYSVDGRVLLAQGVELTDRIIDRLKQYGISYVYIQDPMFADLQEEPTIPDEICTSAVAKIRHLFHEHLHSVQKCVSWSKMYRELEEIFEHVYREIIRHKQTMIRLNQIYTYDAYLYKHSYQVGVYAMIIAIQHQYSKQRVFEMAMGSFLHDIGKLCIPREIVNKPGKLTEAEYEEVKRHTIYGYDILRQESCFSLLSAHVALQHHERLDGSGYPRALKGDEIHEYAKIVAIADVYDAMTTSRVYRQAMLPDHVMEMLYAGSGSKFDTQYLTTFRNSIVLYPVGLTVTLNTGERGVVVDNNTSTPHRPIVRVFEDAERRAIPPYEVDLTKALSIEIVHTEI
ncbi:MAG: hypothetical protein BAA01_03335 [Bacillus thermozeamaize]|uniref:HD-GYP domain-containing protein n=1 Tax=Bacillus thermozeamaize TaxID=230954 RepID=A0A1Y3PPX2_9BACI|nr:MAG: hypothetical protein BAA01_03335 [Bacillus thermozeamaize]